MSHRLQRLIPEALDQRVRKAAQRARLSKGAWVRKSIEQALQPPQSTRSPIDRLASLDAPTGDIDQMLAEIEAARS